MVAIFATSHAHAYFMIVLVHSRLVPRSLDPPRFINVTSTSVTVVWDEPAEPNGVLQYYVIYQNGTEIQRVMGNVTSYVVSGLQPFSVYVFKLSVCTAVGCSNSSDSVPQRTLESGTTFFILYIPFIYTTKNIAQ